MVSSQELGKSNARCLNRFSSEVLAQIAHALPPIDLVKLKICGNRHLIRKIRQDLEILTVLVSPLSNWPADAFNHRHLRTLRVLPDLKGMFHPVLAAMDDLMPPVAHPCLVTLEVSVILGLSLLRPQTPSQSLKDVLPALQSLSLSGTGYFEPSYLENVPRTLTDLRVKVQVSSPRLLPNFAAGIMPELPPGLTTLKLKGMVLSFTGDEDWAKLPSTITSLSIGIELGNGAFKIPIIGIRRLSIYGMMPQAIGYQGFRLDVPQRIEKLRIVSEPSLPLFVKQPFPTSLTDLRLPQASWFVADPSVGGVRWRDTTTLLPPSLTRVEGVNLAREIKYHHALLPLCKKSRIVMEPEYADPLFDLAEEVEFADPYTLTHGLWQDPLPTTITKLTTRVLISEPWLRNLAQLVNLRHLHLERQSSPMPSQGFWNLMHTRLETLSTALGPTNSLTDIEGPWTNLKSLGARNPHPFPTS